MPLPSVNSNPGATTLIEVVARLKSDPTFFADFKSTLALANANDQTAIDLIELYLKPTVLELEALEVPKSKVGPARVCTESGTLALVLAAH